MRITRMRLPDLVQHDSVGLLGNVYLELQGTGLCGHATWPWYSSRLPGTILTVATIASLPVPVPLPEGANPQFLRGPLTKLLIEKGPAPRGAKRTYCEPRTNRVRCSYSPARVAKRPASVCRPSESPP